MQILGSMGMDIWKKHWDSLHGKGNSQLNSREEAIAEKQSIESVKPKPPAEFWSWWRYRMKHPLGGK
eukprot:g8239.t1